MSLDSCIKEKHYIGLDLKEAPLHVDYCHEVDMAFQCIRNSIDIILKLKHEYKTSFAAFFHQHEMFKHSCAQNTSNNKKEPEKITNTEKHNSLSSLLEEINNFNSENQEFEDSKSTNSKQNDHRMFEDDKKYYEGKIITNSNLKQNWIDVESFEFLQHGPIKDNEFARNYLKATIVKLKFKFPFYGHMLDKVIIATGGFLYVGSLLNPLITKSQYIAPLMANFDPNLNLYRSSITYVDNSTHFICTWEKLLLKDQLESNLVLKKCFYNKKKLKFFFNF